MFTRADYKKYASCLRSVHPQYLMCGFNYNVGILNETDEIFSWSTEDESAPEYELQVRAKYYRLQSLMCQWVVIYIFIIVYLFRFLWLHLLIVLSVGQAKMGLSCDLAKRPAEKKHSLVQGMLVIIFNHQRLNLMNLIFVTANGVNFRIWLRCPLKKYFWGYGVPDQLHLKTRTKYYVPYKNYSKIIRQFENL